MEDQSTFVTLTEIILGSWQFILFIILLFYASFDTFFVTKQKTIKIIEIFGKFAFTTTPGLCIKIPFISKVASTVRTDILQIKGEIKVKTKDNVYLNVPYSIQFQVIETMAKEAHYELSNSSDQINQYLINNIRTHANDLTLEGLFAAKNSFEEHAITELKVKFRAYGFQIITVLIDDPQPPAEIQNSFNKVIASVRDKEAALNEAEAIKTRAIAHATGEGESLKIKANAFKEFRKTISEGNSEAINSMLNEIKDDSIKAIDVLNFFAGVDLRDTIRDASKNQATTIVIPVDFQNKTMFDIKPTTK